MGALWETVSFITRSLGSRNQQNLGYATVSQLLLLLAPLCMALLFPILPRRAAVVDEVTDTLTDRGQRIRLHDAGPNDLFLFAGEEGVRRQGSLSSQIFCLAGYYLFHHPGRWRFHGLTGCRSQHCEHRDTRLYGWHWRARILHRDLHRPRRGFPPANVDVRADR